MSWDERIRVSSISGRPHGRVRHVSVPLLQVLLLIGGLMDGARKDREIPVDKRSRPTTTDDMVGGSPRDTHEHK